MSHDRPVAQRTGAAAAMGKGESSSDDAVEASARSLIAYDTQHQIYADTAFLRLTLSRGQWAAGGTECATALTWPEPHRVPEQGWARRARLSHERYSSRFT